MEQNFESTKVITPVQSSVPKTGHIGFVKVESYDYEGSGLKPRLFDVDLREWETVG